MDARENMESRTSPLPPGSPKPETSADRYSDSRPTRRLKIFFDRRLEAGGTSAAKPVRPPATGTETPHHR